MGLVLPPLPPPPPLCAIEPDSCERGPPSNSREYTRPFPRPFSLTRVAFVGRRTVIACTPAPHCRTRSKAAPSAVHGTHARHARATRRKSTRPDVHASEEAAATLPLAPARPDAGPPSPVARISHCASSCGVAVAVGGAEAPPLSPRFGVASREPSRLAGRPRRAASSS